MWQQEWLTAIGVAENRGLLRKKFKMFLENDIKFGSTSGCRYRGSGEAADSCAKKYIF